MSGEQRSLFPGNRGCGVRERGAAVSTFRGSESATVVGDTFAATSCSSTDGIRCVIVRIDGIKLESPNRSAIVSRGARMAQAGRARKIREAVRAHVLGALGVGHAPPSRVVVTRLSFGSLDRDNAWSSTKPVWDGVADAFGLPNDRELQERGDVRQDKCKRGTSGVVIELFFSG